MKSKAKIIIPIVITLVALVLFVIGWTGISKNDYVLKINGQKISMNEFNSYLKLQKKNMEDQFGENVWDILIKDAPAIEFARDAAKQSMSSIVPLVQKAKEMNLELTPEEKQEIKEYSENLKEEWAKFGLTPEEFAKMDEDVTLINKLEVHLFNEKSYNVKHGKLDLDSYIKGENSSNPIITFNSRHILFSTENLDEAKKAEVKSKAEGVLAQVLNGADFASLAKEYSSDPGSKDKGGLYENTDIGVFIPVYEDAIFEIEKGQIYPTLVESDFGYHIIKSEGINNPDGYISYDGSKNIIYSQIGEDIRKCVQDAKIEVNEQRYNSAQ